MVFIHCKYDLIYVRFEAFTARKCDQPRHSIIADLKNNFSETALSAFMSVPILRLHKQQVSETLVFVSPVMELIASRVLVRFVHSSNPIPSIDVTLCAVRNYVDVDKICNSYYVAVFRSMSLRNKSVLNTFVIEL